VLSLSATILSLLLWCCPIAAWPEPWLAQRLRCASIPACRNAHLCLGLPRHHMHGRAIELSTMLTRAEASTLLTRAGCSCGKPLAAVASRTHAACTCRPSFALVVRELREQLKEIRRYERQGARQAASQGLERVKSLGRAVSTALDL
jgi:hypothetical protein